eukprot:8357636-Pyramimonas_sp.AAC.1
MKVTHPLQRRVALANHLRDPRSVQRQPARGLLGVVHGGRGDDAPVRPHQVEEPGREGAGTRQEGLRVSTTTTYIN